MKRMLNDARAQAFVAVDAKLYEAINAGRVGL
jgi:hypothetical protein